MAGRDRCAEIVLTISRALEVLVGLELFHKFPHHSDHAVALTIRRIKRVSAFTNARDQQDESVTCGHRGPQDLTNGSKRLLGFRVANLKIIAGDHHCGCPILKLPGHFQ